MSREEREKLIDQMIDIMDDHESFDGQSMNHNTSGSAEDILLFIESKYKLTRVDVKAENDKYNITPEHVRKNFEENTDKAFKEEKQRDLIKFGLFGNPQDHEPEKYE